MNKIKNMEINYDNLTESQLRDLHLRRLAIGEEYGPLTGKPNIDKPWLKHFSVEAITNDVFDGNIYDYIKNENANRMHSTALQYFGKKISFNQLFKKIDTVAKSFLEMGVKPGDVVTVALPNIPENVIILYALNKIGAVANIINLTLKGDKLQDAISKGNSKIMIATDLFSENLDNVIKDTQIENVIMCSPGNSLPPILKQLYFMKADKIVSNNYSYESWDSFYQRGILSDKTSDYVSSADDAVCILHTSGTTGSPKGAVLTNRNFNAVANQLKYSGLKYKAGQVFLNQVPPFLAYNEVAAMHFPLSIGLKVVMLPTYEPEKFSKNIAKFRPNHVIAGPADWSSFLDDSKARGKKYDYLITMISGSDKFANEKKAVCEEILHDGGCSEYVLEGYGMTEVGAAAVTNLPQIHVDDSVGIPLKNVNICIYDSDCDRELSYGEVGEICFSGPIVMKEYINNSEETNKALRRHADGNIWMHSGDLGYVSENGNLYLKGRLKRDIKRYDGFKVSPYDIEKVLSKSRYVESCCVVGIRDIEHEAGSVPIAGVVLKKDACLDGDYEAIKEELLALCASELDSIYLPKDIVFLDELKLTQVGKVDYRQISSDLEELLLGHSYKKDK